MENRVVITGMGIIAPNAHGLMDYERALFEGRSGIRFVPELKELNFACHVGGVPQDVDKIFKRYFDDEKRLSINENIGYACVAAIDAWKDAGFEIPTAGNDLVDWDTGVIVGSGIGGMDTIERELVPMVKEGQTRRMGSTMVEKIMNSANSARVGDLLALGNQVTSNSSACSTGNEAIIDATYRIRMGLAKRMLAGGSEGSSPYIWAGFDAMRVLCRKFNDQPHAASRPMSASAGGFIPGSGAGILLLESLDSAKERGARIYAEILGGAVNSGGQRMGGSMTAPNPEGVKRCVQDAIRNAKISPSAIDAVNGHLTATFADPTEVKNWSLALGRKPGNFPYINATKSLVGHCLGAAGGVECVAVVLQLYKGFLHPSINCEDIHPEIASFEQHVPQKGLKLPRLRIIAKAGFGFGDVNSCLIFKKWEE